MAYEAIMLYHLHMPLCFLGTFTEYPFLIGISSWFPQNDNIPRLESLQLIGGCRMALRPFYLFR